MGCLSHLPAEPGISLHVTKIDTQARKMAVAEPKSGLFPDERLIQSQAVRWRGLNLHLGADLALRDGRGRVRFLEEKWRWCRTL